MISWCCLPFENSIKHLGSKGISVFAEIACGYKNFALVAQSIEKEEYLQMINAEKGSWEKLREAIINDYPHFTVTTYAQIKFCPFCGCDLSELIERKPKEFDELNKLAKKLQICK